MNLVLSLGKTGAEHSQADSQADPLNEGAMSRKRPQAEMEPGVSRLEFTVKSFTANSSSRSVYLSLPRIGLREEFIRLRDGSKDGEVTRRFDE